MNFPNPKKHCPRVCMVCSPAITDNRNAADVAFQAAENARNTRAAEVDASFHDQPRLWHLKEAEGRSIFILSKGTL